MKRSVLVYAALLVAALVGAYFSWIGGNPDETPEGVAVADFPRADIRRIHWKSDELELTLEPREDERGPYTWVKQTEFPTSEAAGTDPRPSRPDAGAGDASIADAGGDVGANGSDAGPDTGDVGSATTQTPEKPRSKTDEPPKKPEKSVYKASSAVDELYKRLHPIRAVRRIEKKTKKDGRPRRPNTAQDGDASGATASPSTLQKYGLADPQATLTIETTEATRRFEVGDYTYGRRNLYLRAASGPENGSIYVVDAGTVGILKYAKTRLVEEGLTGHRARDIKRIAVGLDGRAGELVHHNLDDPTAAYWTIGETTQKSRPAGSWVDALLRLKVDRYRPDRSTDGLEEALRVTITPRDGEATQLRLLKSPGNSDGTKWFADSPFNRHLVELKDATAEALVDDAARLFSGATP